MNLHIGSNFDDFLLEEDLAEAVLEPALKRVLIWQLIQVIKRCHAARRDGAIQRLDSLELLTGIGVETSQVCDVTVALPMRSRAP